MHAMDVWSRYNPKDDTPKEMLAAVTRWLKGEAEDSELLAFAERTMDSWPAANRVLYAAGESEDRLQFSVDAVIAASEDARLRGGDHHIDEERVWQERLVCDYLMERPRE